AVAVYRRLKADTLIAEVNMGGDMVRAVLREVDPSIPLKEVHATRGKYLRAEPVAALYEQGKAKHVGCFPLLEDEMCDFGPDGLRARSRPSAGSVLRTSPPSPRFAGRREEPNMPDLIRTFSEHGDLARLVLLLRAASVTGAATIG